MYHLGIHRLFTAIVIVSVITLVCYVHFLHDTVTDGRSKIQSYSVSTYKKSNCVDKTKWAVTTSDTTTVPLAMTTLFSSMGDWCLLILGTHPLFSSSHLNMNNSIYLSIEEMASLPYKILSMTALNSFSRKNIGYLYAIDNGAKIIFDLEENNTPLMIHENILETQKSRHSFMSPKFSERDISDNPVWDPSHQTILSTLTSVNKAQQQVDFEFCIPIIQQYLPIHTSRQSTSDGFRNSEYISHPKTLAIRKDTFTPYNANATAHLYDAFWSLLLPKSMGRYASTLWRSYVAQCLFYLIPDACLVFVYPGTNAASSMMNDDTDESVLNKSVEVVKMLAYLPEMFEQFEQTVPHMYRNMLDQSIFSMNDIDYLNAWLSDLKSIGYIFPSLPNKSTLWTSHVQLCIMFNWGAKEHSIRTLLAYYTQFFNRIVLLYDGQWPNRTKHYIPKNVRHIAVNTHHGWFQQRALHHCLKEGEQHRISSIYVADDMFINITKMSHFSTSMVWLSRGKYYNFSNPNEFLNNNWRWWKQPKGWNFYEKFVHVVNSFPEQWKQKLKANGFPERMEAHSIADIIYIPKRFTGYFIDAIDHINNMTELFCEIVYPLMIGISVPESQTREFSQGNLWDDERKNITLLKEWSETRHYIHGLKLSTWFGRNVWCALMNKQLKLTSVP